MFKVKHNLCSEITSYIFMERTSNQYNLHNRLDFITPRVNSVFHVTESISYLRPKIRDIGPEKSEHNKSNFKCGYQLTVLAKFT